MTDDSLKIAQRLRAAGLSRDQADAIAQEIWDLSKELPPLPPAPSPHWSWTYTYSKNPLLNWYMQSQAKHPLINGLFAGLAIAGIGTGVSSLLVRAATICGG